MESEWDAGAPMEDQHGMAGGLPGVGSLLRVRDQAGGDSSRGRVLRRTPDGGDLVGNRTVQFNLQQRQEPALQCLLCQSLTPCRRRSALAKLNKLNKLNKPNRFWLEIDGIPRSKQYRRQYGGRSGFVLFQTRTCYDSASPFHLLQIKRFD